MAYNSTIDKAVDDILIYGNTAKDGSGTSYVPLLDTDGHLQLDVLTSGLPTGASTSANQTTIIGHLDGVEGLLTTIDADTSALAAAVSGTEMQVDVITMPTVTVNAHAVTNAGTFAVQVDGNALTSLQLLDDVVATLGTTTYTEAATKGNVIAAVRRDADTTLVDTTNELAPLIVDARGFLKTEVFSGETLPVSFTGSTDVATQTTLASLLTSSQLIDDVVYTDDTSTHATGTSKGVGIMAAAVPTDTAVNANDIGFVGMTANRELYVSLITALPTGANAIGKLAANSGVDIGDVDVTSIIPGTGATNQGKAIDAVVGATDTGVMALAVRDDTLNIRSGAENDYEPLHTNANGALWSIDVNSATMLTALQLIDDTVFVDDAAFTVTASKVNAIGLMADETSPDSVDEGDIGIPRMTLDRKQITTSYPSATTGDGLSIGNFNSGDTFTALTATAQVIKASAGNFYGYYIYNPNAAATYVMLYNVAAASVTVGTTTPAMVFCIPATAGANLSLAYPIPFTNAGWSIAAATTGGGNTAPATALEAMIFYK